MTPLRKQLESAREQYRSRHYPGDLAREILARRSRSYRLIAIGGSLAAIAAAVLIYFGTMRAVMNKTTPVAFNPAQPRIAAPTTSPTAVNSLMPDYIEITPPGQSFSMPAIELVPSWSAIANSSSNSSTATTKESA